MKLNFLALLMICFLFTNCKNKSETSETINISPIEYVLNFENDSCKLVIKEVNKSNFSSYKNSHQSAPFLEMKADCISLKELLGIIKGIEVNSIIFNNKSFENQYYSVFIDQKVISDLQDSIIKSNIIESLNVVIEKETFNIDTLMVSVDNRVKFLKYANTTISDTIRSQSRLSQDSIIFENYNLERILAFLSKEFDKTLCLSVEEPQRLNIKISKSDWNSTKIKLESDLGLDFNIERTHDEKYTVRKDNLTEKN